MAVIPDACLAQACDLARYVAASKAKGAPVSQAQAFLDALGGHADPAPASVEIAPDAVE